MIDDVSRKVQPHPADFYLNAGEDPLYRRPALHIDGNVAEVLFVEGLFAELNDRLELSPGLAQHEGHILPQDCLSGLAEVCRDIAGRFGDAKRQYEARRIGVSERLGTQERQYTVVIGATGQDVRDAVLALASLAKQASESNTGILAIL